MRRGSMSRAVLMLVPLLAWGCGGGGEGAPIPADATMVTDAHTAAGPDLTPAPGTSLYIVPGPPDVAYPIDPADVVAGGGELRVDYDLPALLVGTRQHVSLRGPLDGAGMVAQVSGSAGTGTCTRNPGGGLLLHCTETLTGVRVDLAAVEKVAMAEDPANVAARLAIARKFAGEPIGILEVR